MSRKTVVRLFIAIIIILIIAFTALIVDLNEAVQNVEPKFSFNTNTYNDGNTKEYIGLGYKIIRYNIEAGEYHVKLGTLFLKHEDSLEYEKNVNEEKKDTTVYSIIGKVIEIKQVDEEKEYVIESTNSMSIYYKASVVIDEDTKIEKNGLTLTEDNIEVGSNIKVKFVEPVIRNTPDVKAMAQKIEFVR